jgi:arylformamidase
MTALAGALPEGEMSDHQSRVIDRRRLLAGAAAGGMLAGAMPAWAQTPARAKGPPVWLDLDQQELDDAYDQSKYAANIQQVLRRYAANSDVARAALGAPKRLAYGPSEIEKLDLYATKKSNAPVNVLIHGGAWRAGEAKNYAFAAELFVNAGAHLVVLDFINVLEAGGDLMPMAEQVRRAVAWVYQNAHSFGGDPSRLYVSGHSSGAHLGGVVLVTDWQQDFGLPKDVVKGGLLCSGLYDLKPVRLSARSNYVKFTDAMEHALSTQRHLDRLAPSLVLAHGSLETPEFQRQTREFAAAVKAAGKPVQLLIGKEYNHFEILETLANPYGLLGRVVLEQMRLTPA